MGEVHGLPDGASLAGTKDGLGVEIHVAADRAPTGDPMLDQIVRADGVTTDQGRGLLAELHEALGPVIDGLLRSGV